MLLPFLLAVATPAVALPAPSVERVAVPAVVAEPAPPAPPVPAARPAGRSAPALSSRPELGFLSAGNLRERCESSVPAMVSYCFAYITGVHDAVRAYETWLRFREFCPRVLSSQADLRRAFLAYVKNNPQAAGGEAASVVVLSLKDQFPCTAAEGADGENAKR